MSRGPRFTENDVREAVTAASSYTDALRRLGMRPAGGNHRTLRKYVEEIWCIPTDHFDPRAASRVGSSAAARPSRWTLDTHCGKNVNRIRLCATCGANFVPKGRDQRHCSLPCGGRSEASVIAQIAARTVERPPYEVLLREIADTNYVAVGRKYGVSDNAIRKWLRAYERELGVAPLPRAA